MACKIMARQFGVMLSQLHEISWSDLPYCFSKREAHLYHGVIQVLSTNMSSKHGIGLGVLSITIT